MSTETEANDQLPNKGDAGAKIGDSATSLWGELWPVLALSLIHI